MNKLVFLLLVALSLVGCSMAQQPFINDSLLNAIRMKAKASLKYAKASEIGIFGKGNAKAYKKKWLEMNLTVFPIIWLKYVGEDIHQIGSLSPSFFNAHAFAFLRYNYELKPNFRKRKRNTELRFTAVLYDSVSNAAVIELAESGVFYVASSYSVHLLKQALELKAKYAMYIVNMFNRENPNFLFLDSSTIYVEMKIKDNAIDKPVKDTVFPLEKFRPIKPYLIKN